jgi:hypothetical protein
MIMNKAENRIIQAAWHGIAYAALGQEASQVRRKAFISLARGSGRTKMVCEARVIFTHIMREQGFTYEQIARMVARTRQTVSYHENCRKGWLSSDAEFRRLDAAASREFNRLLAL